MADPETTNRNRHYEIRLAESHVLQRDESDVLTPKARAIVLAHVDVLEAVMRVIEVIVQVVVPAMVIAEFTGIYATAPALKAGVNVTAEFVLLTAVPIVP